MSDAFDYHWNAAELAYKERGAEPIVVVRCTAMMGVTTKPRQCRGEIAAVYWCPHYGPLLERRLWYRMGKSVGRLTPSTPVSQTGGRRSRGVEPERWLLKFEPPADAAPWKLPDRWDVECSHGHGEVWLTRSELIDAAAEARRTGRRREILRTPESEWTIT